MTRTYAAGISALILIMVSVPAASGDYVGFGIPSYYQQLDFNLTSPTAYTTAVGSFANPAVNKMMPGSELEYHWSADTNDVVPGLDKWGLFWSMRGLSFGAVHERFPKTDGPGGWSVTDYRVALAGGSRSQTVGVSLGWSRGDTEELGRGTVVQVGVVERYNKWASLGMAGTFSTERSDQTGLFDVALRPLRGDNRFTMFADLELPRGVALENAPWSIGALAEPVRGFKLIGRYFENEGFAVSFAYTLNDVTNLGVVRASASPSWNKDHRHVRTNYSVRVGYSERNGVGERILRDKRYLAMNLKGRVLYSRYKYFDKGPTFYRVLQNLEMARKDKTIAGVAINLSGTRLSRGKAWEIRRKLEQLQQDGKTVVAYIDLASMTEYHLASVADRIVMNPEGLMLLPGYVMGRTFIANLLDKMGLGFDELRFFKYKSAAEGYARHEMSEADREQRQALVDEYYDEMRNVVSASRGVTGEDFDHWINELTLISPGAAVEHGLVDELGQWSDVKQVVSDLEQHDVKYTRPRMLADRLYKSQRWGEPPHIAVVYAIGACAMDSGINARRLERAFGRLTSDEKTKAVVFRVDSPGGMGMASDIVSQALKKCAKKKPVIVTQGDVAASGGYWLSVYGDEILAQPTTITGSIGVIAGWVWDQGLGEKIGLEGDFVKAGDHADLFFGLRMPLLGIPVPHRGLTSEERDRAEANMLSIYDGFVEKVAAGRKMSKDAVEKLAQGRVWTGTAGVENGLIDRIGGLDDAIVLARAMAGIGEAEEVKLVEYGTKGQFNFGGLRSLAQPFPFRFWGGRSDAAHEEPIAEIELLEQYEMLYLKQILKNNGRAMCILPPDFLPQLVSDPAE